MNKRARAREASSKCAWTLHALLSEDPEEPRVHGCPEQAPGLARDSSCRLADRLLSCRTLLQDAHRRVSKRATASVSSTEVTTS